VEMIVKSREEAIRIFGNYLNAYKKYLKNKEGKQSAEIERFVQDFYYYLDEILNKKINEADQLLATALLLAHGKNHYFLFLLRKPFGLEETHDVAISMETITDVAFYLAKNPFRLKKASFLKRLFFRPKKSRPEEIIRRKREYMGFFIQLVNKLNDIHFLEPPNQKTGKNNNAKIWGSG